MKLKDFDFRIYHKEIGYFKEPAYVLYQREVEQRLPKEIQCKSIDDSEIELFTGFCDTNGKKIYEGDIVSFEADSHDMGILIIAGKVVFKNGRFIIEGYEKIFPHYSFYDFVLKDKGIKIIGNIHDKNFVKNLKKSELQGETK